MELFELENDERFDKRCCELFLTSKGKMTFHCTLCEQIHKNYNSFVNHLCLCHLNDCPEFKDLMKLLIPNDSDYCDNLSSNMKYTDSFTDMETQSLEENIPTTFSEINDDEFDDTNTDNLETVKVKNVKKRNFAFPLNNTSHGEDHKHKCPICSLGFKLKHNMKYHLKRHFSKKPHKCPKCAMDFHTSSEVKLHILRAHSDERNFLCNECGKSYKTKFELSGHIKRHNNQRDYKCQLCDKAYFEKQVLENHMRIHTLERVECKLCSETFSGTNALRHHLKLHQNEMKYTCNICGRRFNQKSALSCHIKISHKTT